MFEEPYYYKDTLWLHLNR